MRHTFLILFSLLALVTFKIQAQDLVLEKYQEVFEKVFQNIEIEKSERRLITEVVFSYFNDPTQEKELFLK